MKTWKMTNIAILCVGLSGAFTAASAQTLKDTVQYTLQTNPDVLEIAMQREASRETVNQARAGFFPKVDVKAEYGYKNHRKETSSKTSDDSDDKYKLSAHLRQMIFDGFATSYDVARTKARTNADAYKVWGTSEDVALAATRAYLDVMRNQELVAVARKNVDTHRRIASMIERRSDSGIARGSESGQSKGRLALARSNYYAAKNKLHDAIVTYHKVTGLIPKGLQHPHAPWRSELPKNEREAIDLALRQEATLKSAVADVVEAHSQRLASRSTRFPQLDLVLGADEEKIVDDEDDHKESNLEAKLELSYNLFNGGRDRARQRETVFLAKKAEQIRNRTAREVIEKSRLSWHAYKIAGLRLAKLKTHQLYSGDTLEAYKKQYKVGKRTLLDTLDAENEYFSAQTNYINGRYDLLFSKYRLLNSMSCLLAHLHVPLPSQAGILYPRYAR